MKTDIHPNYEDATITCSCGSIVETRATKKAMHVDVCAACHPFFTGEQRIVDTAGRVERFQRRYSMSIEDPLAAKDNEDQDSAE
jgi:large subunit ribosomal protein L31